MGDYDCKINEKVFMLSIQKYNTENNRKRSDLKCEMYLLRHSIQHQVGGRCHVMKFCCFQKTNGIILLNGKCNNLNNHIRPLVNKFSLKNTM